ncbi:2-deoxyglucose-6-phosphate hydrolase YniC [Methylophaga frappieri]|uniref:2-deoxyglucose-6-phosphate hydrolase YniC n=1 Tax=Methylophaga frappieri (strain ATCC BAA-2434 / DSM 25690 / JAM7) TaxID=754477 RepID=I1YGV0_METFJ|nr:HAD-IA family hydrolase [Methylophaga frappieri]AFJ02143.1 2-deoxyglucose-6-phosphate hydrolase YniC [Methylophaga frappieri]
MQAVIFDMDGLLIDSEPFWKQAEKRVFTSVGVNITDDLSAKTMGMTTREATIFWLNHAGISLSPKDMEKVENDVIDEVAMLTASQGIALPGVHDLLEKLQTEKLKIGLATNAPSRLVPVVLNRLAITDFFDCYVADEDVEQGKPHPAIYQLALTRLNAKPEHSLAFEDSITGMTAAMSAGIKTIVVPSKANFHLPKYDLAVLKLESLTELPLRTLQNLF